MVNFNRSYTELEEIHTSMYELISIFTLLLLIFLVIYLKVLPKRSNWKQPVLYLLIVYTGIGLGYFLIEQDKYTMKKQVYFSNMERIQKEEFNNTKRIELGKTRIIEQSDGCFARAVEEVKRSCYVLREKQHDDKKVNSYFVYLNENQVLKLASEETISLEVYNFSNEFIKLLTDEGLLLDNTEFTDKNEKRASKDKITRLTSKFNYKRSKVYMVDGNYFVKGLIH